MLLASFILYTPRLLKDVNVVQVSEYLFVKISLLYEMEKTEAISEMYNLTALCMDSILLRCPCTKGDDMK